MICSDQKKKPLRSFETIGAGSQDSEHNKNVNVFYICRIHLANATIGKYGVLDPDF
jgi:hypothetical protein